ncbi:hypothetical protein CBR_g22109 [Chara braunii]|uniref:CCHC-type domain-containing protein n=1 Tax=Chara braunii TaxID=69332 RepID=A0A388L2A4_CHABU|nr:hypothetical protein CBR_g22109 [Chara braunii]|eukprot:GBG76362.1 hypothetical protein CBR_g22109 [Chara braunii]
MASRDHDDRGEQKRGDRPRGTRDDGGERRPYRPPMCFVCQEIGHYANQCPNRSRRSNARPSSSSDSRRSRSLRGYDSRRREIPQPLNAELWDTIAKLGKSVAVMEEHYAAEREKKEAKRKKKLEKEEALRQEEEERVRREKQRVRTEKKMLKAKQKKALEAEARVAMQKDMSIQLAIQVGDLENRLVERMYQVVAPALTPSQERGKKKVRYASNSDEASPARCEDSDTSVTKELNEKTERLSISEKSKRGAESVFKEPSPPMELPAKRTQKRGIMKPVKLTGLLTRSKSKKAGGGWTPKSNNKKIATPISKRHTSLTRAAMTVLTPAAKGALARLRYRNDVLKELKSLDATELQSICREEGLHYDKKIDAIFDIADYRTEQAFEGSTTGNVEVIDVVASENLGGDGMVESAAGGDV